MTFFRNLYSRYQEDGVAVRSAALAYYTLASLVPLIILILVLGGLFLPEAVLERFFIVFFERRFGDMAGPFFDVVFRNLSNNSAGIIASALTFVFAIYGGWGLFDQLSMTLRQIFKTEKISGNSATFLSRFAARILHVVFIFGFIILLFAVNAISLLVAAQASEFLSGGTAIVLANIASLIANSFLFGFLYHQFSGRMIRWVDCLVGGFVGSIFILVMNSVLTVYFTISPFLSVYGASAFVAVLLLWVYYVGQLLFVGAEVAKLKSDKRLTLTTPL